MKITKRTENEPCVFACLKIGEVFSCHDGKCDYEDIFLKISYEPTENAYCLNKNYEAEFDHDDMVLPLDAELIIN